MKIILVIVYASMLQPGEPSMRYHEIASMDECQVKAAQIRDKARGGKTMVTCWRVPK